MLIIRGYPLISLFGTIGILLIIALCVYMGYKNEKSKAELNNNQHDKLSDRHNDW